MTPERAKAARDLLAFYMEAGVDAVIGEEPTNWFAERDAATQPAARAEAGPSATPTARMAPRGERPPTALARPSAAKATSDAGGLTPPPSPDVAIVAARDAAKTADSLARLQAILGQFDGCALKNTATQLVFADGNPQARLMFVGEAPGRDEDLAGLPFVGRSGQLLDRMLAAIGLDRTTAYIANIVPWRPPGNRKPTPQEAAICLPFLQRQIALVDPDVLVCLGDSAAQTLLGFREGITRSRGRWVEYDTGTRVIRAMATFHPAYLLRTPLSKRLAWRDFLSIKKALGA
ncbi:MAG TPA: uracil-DNA glycosylase [Xanthobacteraceae bacterium]|nr:uracil-DNA glycosylase [Xanthobacteraceae bacterium]